MPLGPGEAIPGSRPIGRVERSANIATRASVPCVGSPTFATVITKMLRCGSSSGMIAETIRFVMTNASEAPDTSSMCRSCSKTAISGPLDDGGAIEDQGALLRVQLVGQELQPPERRRQVFVHPDHGVPRPDDAGQAVERSPRQLRHLVAVWPLLHVTCS